MNRVRALFIVPIALVFFVTAFVAGVPAFADAQAENMEGGAEEMAEDGLTDEERQALLTEMGQQLEEMKRELVRISLVVATLELKQQAFALEQQLQQRLAQQGVGVEMPVAGTQTPEIGVAEVAPGGEPPAQPAPVSQEEEPGPPAGGEEAVATEDEEEQGFLAALGPFGNLRAPELIALAILVFLVVFMLRRRMREGKGRSGTPAKTAPSAPRPFSPQNSGQAPAPSPSGGFSQSQSSPPQQGVLQQQRDELKERVAWE